MVLCSFLTSVEFYVVAAVVAAAVIGYSVSPGQRGEERRHLLAGTLCDLGADAPSGEYVAVRCTDSGDVLLTRTGLQGITIGGAVSLVVKVRGFDVDIEERLVADPRGEEVNAALFTLDFIGQERYNVRYTSPDIGLMAVFTLRNRPGMRFDAPLKR